MLRWRQRIRKLERSPLFQPPPDPVNNVISRALQKLSDEDLDLLCNMARDREGGVDRTLSERESAAVQAYNAALASEMPQIEPRP